MIVVGFTGTRKGMTHEQCEAVAFLLDATGPFTGALHGDCVGADAQFHELVADRGMRIFLHPGPDGPWRAHCTRGLPFVAPEQPFTKRNQTIVGGCHVLVAVSGTAHEPRPGRGQGTWSTVRYARRIGRAVYIVWPDGSFTFEANRRPATGSALTLGV